MLYQFPCCISSRRFHCNLDHSPTGSCLSRQHGPQSHMSLAPHSFNRRIDTGCYPLFIICNTHSQFIGTVHYDMKLPGNPHLPHLGNLNVFGGNPPHSPPFSVSESLWMMILSASLYHCEIDPVSVYKSRWTCV